MRGRWLIALFTVVFAIICIFRLSHTFYIQNIQNKAENEAAFQTDSLSRANPNLTPAELSTQRLAFENKELERLAEDTLDLIIQKYNYNSSLQKEMNLGLDLKGGINLILQIRVRDLLEDFSNYSQDSTFVEALNLADNAQTGSADAYVEIFFREFDKLRTDKNLNLPYASPDIFGNQNNAEKIKFNTSDDDVKDIIRDEINSKVGTAYQVIRSRVDRFGVSQPNVQRLGGKADGRILVELAGVKDTDRVINIVGTTAKLEFWEVARQNAGVSRFISNSRVKSPIDSTNIPLIGLLPNVGGQDNVYSARIADTIKINRAIFGDGAPDDVVFAYENKPILDPDTGQATERIYLYALQKQRGGDAPYLLDGSVISSASAERNMQTISNEPYVSMSMKTEGAQKWGTITTNMVNRRVAVVLDGQVYSAPNINEPILGGTSSISGNFTMEEATDLANVLQAGSLPARADILQSEVVGPSLGKETIRRGLISFAIAFLVVLVWMIFYYSGAGIIADITLLVNVLFLFGALASVNATLTLPGIAGIILTIGMAVDANVIIFERVKEELLAGKNIKQAVAKAFSWSGAISAIVDANVTTMITAIILMVFGSGPIYGFAFVLLIGILTSLFTAIILGLYFISGRLDNNKSVAFFTSVSKKWLQNLNFKFISKRKIAVFISGGLILISLISLFSRGLNFGIDFVGGRNYLVRFEQPISADVAADALASSFVDENGTTYNPQVKNFGPTNQIRVSTKYKVNEKGQNVDTEIRKKLYSGLKQFLPEGLTLEEFINTDGDTNAKVGILSSSTVGPTIADDIKQTAVVSVLLALGAVFLYILLRFRKWQFSAGAVIAVFHDVIITLGIFSIFKGILPFSLEIDQAFIAAILTVIGYSLNDTVIVFDRIREFLGEYRTMRFGELIDKAINTTLSRTINTSLTTLFVILTVFIFGGETIRGFMFALLVGVVVGTYSSVFVATPLMYQFTKKQLKNREA